MTPSKIKTSKYINGILVAQAWDLIEEEINKGIHFYYRNGQGLACLITVWQNTNGIYNTEHHFLNAIDTWQYSVKKENTWRDTTLVRVVEELADSDYNIGTHMGKVINKLSINTDYAALRRHKLIDWGHYTLQYQIRRINYSQHKQLTKKYELD